MAVRRANNTVSFKAGGAIGKNNAVKLDTSVTTGNSVIVAAANTDKIIGFSLMDAASGKEVPVAIISQSVIMKAGSGGVTINDWVVLDATYPATKVITFTQVKTGGTQRQVLGIAMHSAVEGADVEVMMLSFTDTSA